MTGGELRQPPRLGTEFAPLATMDASRKDECDPHEPLRRAIARIAAAVADDAEMTTTGRASLLDQLGFGRISATMEEEARGEEPIDLEAECARLRPFGFAVTLPVLAALGELASGEDGITEDKLVLIEEIAAKLSNKPGWLRIAA